MVFFSQAQNRARKARNGRGVTLVEVLFSLVIAGLLLTICADLMARYSMIVQHQEKKNRSLANITMALDTMSSEIEEALTVYSPGTDGQLLTTVSLWRYDPLTSDQMLTARSGITVTYFLDSGTLYRRVATDSSTEDCPVAHEIAGFSVRRENSRLFTVSVSLEEAQRIYTLDSKACLKTGL
jgi:prepilin-type N-terminal cleavage/methylation domain-containing protein